MQIDTQQGDLISFLLFSNKESKLKTVADTGRGGLGPRVEHVGTYIHERSLCTCLAHCRTILFHLMFNFNNINDNYFLKIFFSLMFRYTATQKKPSMGLSIYMCTHFFQYPVSFSFILQCSSWNALSPSLSPPSIISWTVFFSILLFHENGGSMFL